MKKKTKGLFVLTGALAAAAAVNHYIFRKSARSVRDDSDERTYPWKYGTIRYTVTGSGEPLVLLHGIEAGASRLEWEKCVAALSKRYRVYTPDLLGFGRSDKPGMSYSAYLYTTMINDFVRDVIGRKVYAAGSSVSATFLVMACSFQPSYYRKLLLVSPTGAGNCGHGATHKDVWLNWLLSTRILGTSVYNFFASKRKIEWKLKQYGFCDPRLVTGRMVNAHHQMAHWGGPGARNSFAEYKTNFLHANIEYGLPQIEIPVHVVWGKENLLNPAENFRDLKEKVPGMEWTVLERCRLYPHIEKCRAFVSVCREFFAEE